MKTDFLFTTWNCQECSELKLKIREEAIYDDDFTGNDGQTLSVIHTFSNSATEAILEKFEFPEKITTPALYTHNDTMIWKIKDIESYLKEQGFLHD
jgi:hypothetical protein